MRFVHHHAHDGARIASSLLNVLREGLGSAEEDAFAEPHGDAGGGIGTAGDFGGVMFGYAHDFVADVLNDDDMGCACVCVCVCTVYKNGGQRKINGVERLQDYIVQYLCEYQSRESKCISHISIYTSKNFLSYHAWIC